MPPKSRASSNLFAVGSTRAPPPPGGRDAVESHRSHPAPVNATPPPPRSARPQRHHFRRREGRGTRTSVVAARSRDAHPACRKSLRRSHLPLPSRGFRGTIGSAIPPRRAPFRSHLRPRHGTLNPRYRNLDHDIHLVANLQASAMPTPRRTPPHRSFRRTRRRAGADWRR